MHFLKEAGDDMEKELNHANRQKELMQSIWRLQKSIMVRAKKTAASNDLTMPQFSILEMMRNKQQIAQKELQTKTHFPKSTLSYAIEGLVQAGILQRTPVEGNRREMELSLSEQGLALINHMKLQEDGVYVRFKQAVDSFSDEEFTELIHLHQHIVSFFEGSETE